MTAVCKESKDLRIELNALLAPDPDEVAGMVAVLTDRIPVRELAELFACSARHLSLIATAKHVAEPQLARLIWFAYSLNLHPAIGPDGLPDVMRSMDFIFAWGKTSVDNLPRLSCLVDERLSEKLASYIRHIQIKGEELSAEDIAEATGFPEKVVKRACDQLKYLPLPDKLPSLDPESIWFDIDFRRPVPENLERLNITIDEYKRAYTAFREFPLSKIIPAVFHSGAEFEQFYPIWSSTRREQARNLIDDLNKNNKFFIDSLPKDALDSPRNDEKSETIRQPEPGSLLCGNARQPQVSG